MFFLAFGRLLAVRSNMSGTEHNPASRVDSMIPELLAVTVNCYGEGDITTPFGGYKQSGFGGRDNGIHAHDQYCEIKTIWVDLSDRQPEEGVDG